MVIQGKVVAISTTKEFYKVGESYDDSIWFTKTPEVESICNSLKKGWKVEIDYEWGEGENGRKKAIMKSIEVLEKNNEEVETAKNKSIERQAIMKAACEAVKGVDGVSVANLESTVLRLYDAMYKKIRE